MTRIPAPASRATATGKEPRREVVHVFPGQGDFSVTTLLRAVRQNAALHDALREVFELTDPVGAEEGIPPVGKALLGSSPPNGRDLAEAPVGTSQLVLFTACVAIHRALRAANARPDRLVAVSFGEIPALVASGSLDVADGARIACQLARYMARTPGAMLRMEANERATAALLAARPRQGLALACVNDPGETVVSGPATGVAELERLATARRIPVSRLRLGVLAHHPALSDVAEAFHRFVGRFPVRPPVVPVHSAVNGLYGAPEELARGLANSLILPVRLPTALHDAVVAPAVVLEIGTGQALTRNIRRTVPDGMVSVYNPLCEPSFSWQGAAGRDGAHVGGPRVAVRTGRAEAR